MTAEAVDANNPTTQGALAMTDTTDTDTPTTPEQLLTDLGEFHTRTLVSPLPKHPAAMGWQAVAGSMAAGFARVLHALNEVDPAKAAEITAWFDGPFGEGPDPEEHTDWLERTVAGGDLSLLEKWVEDGRRMAELSKAATEEWAAGELKPLLDVLRSLASPEPCAWEGVYCVTHSWKSDVGRCPHGQAQALLGGGA